MGWAKHVKTYKLRRRVDWNSRLDLLNREDSCEEVLTEIIELKLGLNFEAGMKELFWEQRTRANWVCFGDRNTSFFIAFPLVGARGM